MAGTATTNVVSAGDAVFGRAAERRAAAARRRATAADCGHRREALTPSERRVSGLAMEGMTNKEIAQALFVTLRTVELHLSNSYRKLGISGREQLPAALSAH